MNLQRKIAVLGSTGSIGCQALDIIRSFPDRLIAEVLTANHNAELLVRQALEFLPNIVVIADTEKYEFVKHALAHTDVKVFTGQNSLIEVSATNEVDMVLIALVGFSGLQSAIKAIKSGKHIALANKEILVVAGEYIMTEAFNHNVAVLPVDSEHSAIFQSLVGEDLNHVEKIILTASGGPFRTFTKQEIEHVTVEDALKHPNWSMGNKITIDSATMMNKGLEVIEARHLFHLKPESVDVVVHPQSVVHSMVQFVDGSIKAQLGVPDMRLPILYAFSYPERWNSQLPRLNFTENNELTFFEVDKEKFPCLQLAYEAMYSGGSMPCIMNAANEIAVSKFLHGKISFTDIPKLVYSAMKNTNLFSKNPQIEDLIEIDKLTRTYVKNK